MADHSFSFDGKEEHFYSGYGYIAYLLDLDFFLTIFIFGFLLIYCYSAYSYMQSISSNIRLDDSQLESKFWGEITTTSDMKMIPTVAGSEEELKSLLLES